MDGNKHPDPMIDKVIHLATTSVDQALEMIKLLPTPVQIDEDSKLFKSLAEIRRIVSPTNKADIGIQADFITNDPETTNAEADTISLKSNDIIELQPYPDITFEEKKHTKTSELNSSEKGSILDLVKPKYYKSKPGEKVTIFGNSEDCIKLLNIASKAMNENNYIKAKRMAEKSDRIFSTPAAKKLLNQIRIVTEAREESARLDAEDPKRVAAVAQKRKMEDKEESLLAAEKAILKKAQKAALLVAERYKIVKAVKAKAILAAVQAKRSAFLSAAAKVLIRKESVFTVPVATFRYAVRNISQLKDQVLSLPYYLRSMPWKILAQMHQTHTPGGQQMKSLGLYVQCNGECVSPEWSCYVRGELKLISHKPDGQPLSRKLNHMYNAKANDWGYQHFILWKDLMNPENGFVKDDTITVEAHIIAVHPMRRVMGSQ